jgi:hypothetical protein
MPDRMVMPKPLLSWNRIGDGADWAGHCSGQRCNWLWTPGHTRFHVGGPPCATRFILSARVRGGGRLNELRIYDRGNVRASTRLRWHYNRTRDVWYGRARRIDAVEMDALRAEARRQAAKYENLARQMVTTDPEFYQPEIAALCHVRCQRFTLHGQ